VLSVNDIHIGRVQIDAHLRKPVHKPTNEGKKLDTVLMDEIYQSYG
jgi:hypothetical protein